MAANPATAGAVIRPSSLAASKTLGSALPDVEQRHEHAGRHTRGSSTFAAPRLPLPMRRNRLRPTVSR